MLRWNYDQKATNCLDALDKLPDDTTLDDIEDRHWLLMEIERGLTEAEAGRGIPQEEVVKYFRDKFGIPVHEHEELSVD